MVLNKASLHIPMPIDIDMDLLPLALVPEITVVKSVKHISISSATSSMSMVATNAVYISCVHQGRKRRERRVYV